VPHDPTAPESARDYVRRVGRSLGVLTVLVASLLGMMMSASSCKTVAPTYDGQVIAATTRLATDADTLLKRATQPYDRHQVSVEAMRVRLEKMKDVATARGRGNMGVVAQWGLISQPRAEGGHLLGALLDEWATNATLAEPLLGHRRQIVREAFRAVLSAEQDRPPGLQDRLMLDEVLGSDAEAAEADLFPGTKGDPLPEGKTVIR